MNTYATGFTRTADQADEWHHAINEQELIEAITGLETVLSLIRRHRASGTSFRLIVEAIDCIPHACCLKDAEERVETLRAVRKDFMAASPFPDAAADAWSEAVFVTMRAIHGADAESRQNPPGWQTVDV